MYKKLVCFILVGLLLNSAFYSTAKASGESEKRAKFAAKVKTEIGKLGIGRDARIKVKLFDGRKLKGYVKEIRDDEFIVVNEKNNVATSVNYSNVKQVKGNNLSSERVIGIAIVLTMIVAIFALTLAKEDD